MWHVSVIYLNNDDSGLFGGSRRAFLTKTALTSGGLALGTNGVAATDDGTETAKGNGDSQTPHGGGVCISPTSDDFNYDSISLNEADVEFIQTMITHHWGAVVLAFLVPERSDRESLVELVQTIVDVQYTQIERMEQMLLDSGVDEVPSDAEIPECPLTAGWRCSVRSKANVDAVWINIMSAHHRGGIILGRRVLEEGESEVLRDLAKGMIRAQERQIYDMYQNYVDWMEPPSEEPLPEEVGDEDDEDTGSPSE